MPVFLCQNYPDNSCIQIKQIPLAGKNGIIYRLWNKIGKLKNRWHISKKDIIVDVRGTQSDYAQYTVIIDAAPSVKNLVDLVELQEIFVYTYLNDESKTADWSNLMLVVKDILWEEKVSEEQKESLTKKFSRPPTLGDDIFTFLYLHGETRAWNFGRLGQMNGAWIHKPAREYFKTVFSR